jgi:hypothetical protein
VLWRIPDCGRRLSAPGLRFVFLQRSERVETKKVKMTAISSFITSLITSAIIFFILVIIYNILSRRPGNRYIYYPALILRGLDTPETQKSRYPWTWIVEAWRAKESDIIAVGGLDAAVYLQLFNAGKFSICWCR